MSGSAEQEPMAERHSFRAVHPEPVRPARSLRPNIKLWIGDPSLGWSFTQKLVLGTTGLRSFAEEGSEISLHVRIEGLALRDVPPSMWDSANPGPDVQAALSRVRFYFPSISKTR